MYMLVHLHIFLAGYAFTASMLYIDPAPHRKSYMYRAIVSESPFRPIWIRLKLPYELF
ncbi:cytochrome c oxidase assembly protein [Paenibacillus sp. 1P07SE]|uniref:cytochrome c oxidase assembly protein n=1 Tax=Paenibacillus sp. 1P07SE TaxID=3132209 RepID=UPI0039A58C67